MTDSESDDESDAPRRWQPPLMSAIAAVACLILVGICAVAAYWYSDSQFGKFSQTVGLPLATLAFGAFAADAYYRNEGLKKVHDQVRLSAYTTFGMQRAVDVASGHIDDALTALDRGELDHLRASLAGAETANYLAMASSLQSIHELDLLSGRDGVVDEVRSRFINDNQEIVGRRPRIRDGSGDTGSSNEGDNSGTQ